MPTRSRPAKTAAALPMLQPDAAGIDLGATEIYAAVPAERDPQPVRAFATFTEDLLALAAWLEACHIRTVAMEATGVYWLPLYQILEARGFEVYLVNGRYRKAAGEFLGCRHRLPRVGVSLTDLGSPAPVNERAISSSRILRLAQ